MQYFLGAYGELLVAISCPVYTEILPAFSKRERIPPCAKKMGEGGDFGKNGVGQGIASWLVI